MPVPEEVQIQHIVEVFSCFVTPDVEKTSVWAQEQASSTDVIESVLENLKISTSAERFDLVEVYQDDGQFKLDEIDFRGRSRTLQEFESPARVQMEWKSREYVQKNGVCRLYIRPKTENFIGECLPGLSVSWLDGLKVEQDTDDWNFEPTYREPDEIDDLVDLPVLDEGILMEHIQNRFKRGRIYTYVGGILIAVNPFKYFPIYNPKYVLAYQHRKLGDLPPHIFAIADVAYHRMLTDKENQCIVISGESGSGKTENTKLILHHLTALSHKTQASLLERTILAAGPVLEAFGNAKTCFNNNSSRFGKFTELTYRADGVVCGAILKKYLLEKSRIVAQAETERNYHVFYYLLAGATQAEKELLSLTEPKDYFYLNQSQYDYVGPVDEGYELVRLQQAMRNIGFNGDVQQRICSVLSAVLHIGNINFKKREGHEESVSIRDTSVVETVSDLLEVSKETLIEAFTKRRTVTRGEVFIRVYKHDEAVATRDAMAKALYGSLFDWIVLQINHILKMRHTNPVRETKAHSIGVLDIFGFEDFAYNSFEQFCINFANENLQFYLNQHIFKMRQDEYLAEGLNWSLVGYADNGGCLNLIAGKPIGLISLLDEECSLSYGTDDSLLEKFNKHQEENSYYEKPSTKEPFFSVVHYAGKVKYQIKDFKAKNRDLMRHDIVTCLRNSKMLFLRELMGADPLAVLRWTILRHMVRAVSLLKKAGAARKSGVPFSQECPGVKWTLTQSPQSRRRFLLQLNGGRDGKDTRDVMRKATKILTRRSMQRQSQVRLRKGVEAKRKISGGMSEYSHRRSGLKSPPTVIAQFQSSLSELMDTLNASHPYFVRCIRSNADKAPMEFEAELVLRQLRYTGMLDTVKIRQLGYPCRLSIKDFLQQYHLLLPKGRRTKDHEIKDCLAHIGLDPLHFQVGRSKVFMRETQYRFLKEKLHLKFDDSAYVIQTWFRRRMARREFLRVKRSALIIQAFWRGYVVRKDFENVRSRHRAALQIQDTYRAFRQQKIDADQREAAITIQKNAKRYLAKKRYLKLKEDKLREERKRQREEQELKDVRDKAEALVEDALSKTIFNDIERPYEEQLRANFTDIDAKPTEKTKSEEDLRKKDFSHHIYEKVHKKRTDSTVSATSSGSSGNEQALEGSESDNEKREEAKAKGRSLLRRLSFKDKKVPKVANRTKSAETRSLNDYVVVPQGSELASPVSEANKKKSLLRSLIKATGKKGGATGRPQGEKGGKGISSLFGSPLSSGGREWTPTDKFIVNGDEDMEIFSQFLSKKVSDMNRSERAKKDTVVDVVFKKALQQYHVNVLTNYASNQKRQENVKLKYDDMTSSFEVILKKTMESDKRGADFPLVIGIHAFNGVVDEFVKYRQQHIRRGGSIKRPRKESKRGKKRTGDLYQHNGHVFAFTSFSIATFCEHCNALIWDRGLVCKGCNFTCHKKCFQKLSCMCKGRKPSATGPHTLFGTDLAEQVSLEEPIPFAIVMLIKDIEERGLLTEGVYRKPGLQASIKSLKNLLCTKPAIEIDVHDFGVYVVASVIKLFFRQLPRPLIPDEFYSEVLRTCGAVVPSGYHKWMILCYGFLTSRLHRDLENETEIHASLYDVVQKFPKPNRELFEMIIIHLARVALNEDCNKMSPNGLAIIWAPCVMRPPASTDAMDGLRQVPLQTKCIETLVNVQLQKIRLIMSEHTVLGEAMETAEKRMKQILVDGAMPVPRANHSLSEKQGTTPPRCYLRLDDRPDGNSEEAEKTSEEYRFIQEQIDSLEEEREQLTIDITSIEPRLNRGFTVDSDDGLTSDDALTDSELRSLPDDVRAMSKKLSASSSDISPSRGKRRKPAKQMRRWFSEKNLNDDSSFEDLSGDTNDDLYIIP